MGVFVLVTGANGFIGKAVCERLLKEGYKVRGAVRHVPLHSLLEHPNFELVAIGDINGQTNWSDALFNIDVVIHTAARVHQLKKSSQDANFFYTEMNECATAQLVEAAIEAKVKKFIFCSTINVYVNQTMDKQLFSVLKDSLTPKPDEMYGISKLAAEEVIQKLCSESVMKFVIFRLPMVYGFQAKGNFPKLLKLVKKKLPLPFYLFKQKRSFLYIGNLISAFLTVLSNTNSDNKTYLLSDQDDVSLADFIRDIAHAYHFKVKLFPIPLFCFKLLGILTGKRKVISRLLGSLQVDSSKIRDELMWIPPYTVRSGLAEMVELECSHKSYSISRYNCSSEKTRQRD